MKKFFFNSLSSIISLLSKSIGPLHSPWTHKKMKYKDVLNMRGILKEGDFILTRTNGEMSTAIIPGFWKHVMIYQGGDRVIHAVGVGVRSDWLADVCMTTDNICIRRLKNVSQTEGTKIVQVAKTFLGAGYDFRQDMRNKTAVSCSELVFHSVNKVRPNHLELKVRMGFPAFTPQDCFDANSKFTTVSIYK